MLAVGVSPAAAAKPADTLQLAGGGEELARSVPLLMPLPQGSPLAAAPAWLPCPPPGTTPSQQQLQPGQAAADPAAAQLRHLRSLSLGAALLQLAWGSAEPTCAGGHWWMSVRAWLCWNLASYNARPAPPPVLETVWAEADSRYAHQRPQYCWHATLCSGAAGW